MAFIKKVQEDLNPRTPQQRIREAYDKLWVRTEFTQERKRLNKESFTKCKRIEVILVVWREVA
jgi:hypothetical protein